MLLLLIIVIGVIFTYFYLKHNKSSPSKERSLPEFKPTLNFVALDFETASSLPESICQVGMVVVRNNEIVHSQSWLVHPHTKHFSKKMIDIHGITYPMVKDAPKFDQIWAEIIPYIKECGVIAAHYALFDTSALIATINHYKILPPVFTIIDSCIAARRAWPQLPNHKLATISNYLNIELKHHDALSDALACAKILIAANQVLKKSIVYMEPEIVCDQRKYKDVFFSRSV